jgi:hypothetical protein
MRVTKWLAAAACVASVGTVPGVSSPQAQAPAASLEAHPPAVDVTRRTPAPKTVEEAFARMASIPGINKALLHQPVNRPDGPRVPTGTTPLLIDDGPLGEAVVSHGCYPAGNNANPNNDCTAPTHWTDKAVTFGVCGAPNCAHWIHFGLKPFYNTGTRSAWVVDELAAYPAHRAWLQYVVNQFNSVYVGQRPLFWYYKGEDIGYGTDCNTTTQHQTIEVCARPGESGTAYASVVPFSSNGHFAYGDVVVQAGGLSGNDKYVEYLIAQEFGHELGLHHNQDCGSVMTYCSTNIGVNYLWYQGDDSVTYADNYDRHVD